MSAAMVSPVPGGLGVRFFFVLSALVVRAKFSNKHAWTTFLAVFPS